MSPEPPNEEKARRSGLLAGGLILGLGTVALSAGLFGEQGECPHAFHIGLEWSSHVANLSDSGLDQFEQSLRDDRCSPPEFLQEIVDDEWESRQGGETTL